MVLTRGTLFFWATAVATGAGIWVIHQQQEEEREVRRWGTPPPPAARSRRRPLSSLPPCRSPLCHETQRLHRGVERDAELYRAKKQQMLAGQLTPAGPAAVSPQPR